MEPLWKHRNASRNIRNKVSKAKGSLLIGDPFGHPTSIVHEAFETAH